VPVPVAKGQSEVRVGMEMVKVPSTSEVTAASGLNVGGMRVGNDSVGVPLMTGSPVPVGEAMLGKPVPSERLGKDRVCLLPVPVGTIPVSVNVLVWLPTLAVVVNLTVLPGSVKFGCWWFPNR